MKITVCFAGVILIMGGLGIARQQQKQQRDACVPAIAKSLRETDSR
jgi:hypothetical protein